MKDRLNGPRSIFLALALTLLGVAAATAQQTQARQSETIRFEVISVDGNDLVIRDQSGARELTVPDDFKFTVDGTPMSVHDLKAGMKGTALVTTTTSITPVYLTQVKKGTVVRQIGTSLYVRTPEGVRKFTKSELDKRGVQIVKDGRPVKITSLREGDELSATIITEGPPIIVTEKEVQATLDAAEPAPAATEPAAEPPPAAGPAAAAEPPAAAAEPPASEPVAAPVAATTETAAPAEEKSGSSWLIWIIVGAIVVIAAFLILRRRKTEA